MIRRWAVRGAHGQLAFEVLRPSGRKVLHGRAHAVRGHTETRAARAAGQPARWPGDLVGLAVTPGAAIGIRRNRKKARTDRWFGPLRLHDPGAGERPRHGVRPRASAPGRVRPRRRVARCRGHLIGRAAAAAETGSGRRTPRSAPRPGPGCARRDARGTGGRRRPGGRRAPRRAPAGTGCAGRGQARVDRVRGGPFRQANRPASGGRTRTRAWPTSTPWTCTR